MHFGPRLARIIVGTAALAFVAACDSTTEPGAEPQFTTMRVTVGSQVITYNKTTGSVTGGPVALTVNQSVNVAAEFLLASGAADTVVSAADFRLTVSATEVPNIQFSRTSPFGGTITATTATTSGAGTMTFALFHIGEGHNEASFNVAVTAAAAP